MAESRNRFHLLTLFAGPLSALVAWWWLPASYAGPDGVAVGFVAGRVTLSLLIWMAVWWLTEAVELSTTALLPIAVLPLFGAVSATDAAAPYAHRLIFLYLGGFVIALSMQRWGLDRRIALNVLRAVGTRPANMIGGFMIATAFLSAFISNTATAAMMLPIALSVIRLLKEKTGGGGENFSVALMLSIAYAATIGGMATLIGTPPNAFLAGFVKSQIAAPYQGEITFARWFLFGGPVSLVMLPTTWWLLTRVLFPVERKAIDGAAAMIADETTKLGPLKTGEKITLTVFVLAGVAWIVGPFIKNIVIAGVSPFAGLSDPVVAIVAAVLLFSIPVDLRKREFTMNWETAKELPFDILILFGGGMSLAAAVKSTGVAEFIGAQASRFAGLPELALIVVIVTAVVFLTELTSNLATTATLLPVLAALGPGLGVHPYPLIFTATLAASCAFMMPVATPPNAIVFGSRLLRLEHMMKAGFWLNIVGIVVIVVAARLLLGIVTGVDLW
jgi:sodium-dependent dicarboxylate transporter 2/3/5